ncbi:MAG: DUF2127 domain-containing protein [Deltaproteobacteria bacterium]|nr:DUF2127 domain-containing protein [Deltaproteobacteria bacterium]
MYHPGKNQKYLKLIIAYKALVCIVELALAFGLLSYLNDAQDNLVTSLVEILNIDIAKHYADELVKSTYFLDSGTLLGISAGLFLMAVISFFEAYGLHMRRRWGEWLTVISTASFIPFEIYAISSEVTLLRVITLIVNCLIVYYLVKHKELFKSKTEI